MFSGTLASDELDTIYQSLKMLNLDDGQNHLTHDENDHIAPQVLLISGVSFDAASSALSGTDSIVSPFLNVRSLISVKRVFRIAGLDFQISSRKAKSAFGR